MCVATAGLKPGLGVHHSVEYSSPELISKLKSEDMTDPFDFCTHDIWSLGCLLAWALTGISLFSCQSREERELGYSYRLEHVCSMQKPWVCLRSNSIVLLVLVYLCSGVCHSHSLCM